MPEPEHTDNFSFIAQPHGFAMFILPNLIGLNDSLPRFARLCILLFVLEREYANPNLLSLIVFTKRQK